MEEGPSLLVTRSQGFAMNSGPKTDELAVEFHFQMASFLCGHTRGQRDDLVLLLNMCIKHNTNAQETIISNSNSVAMQLSVDAVAIHERKKCNTVKLTPPRMIDEHAYVSLHDCVADLLRHGLDVQHISEIEPLGAAVIDASKCHFSQQIYARGISWIKTFHLLIHYGMVGWLSAIYFLKDQ